MNKISVVIPCYNESQNIALMLSAFKIIMEAGEKDFNLEVIVVDGGSTDNSREILQTEFKDLKHENFKLILMDERRGYGHDIIVGLRQASGDVLSWTHADLQTDPEDVVKAYKVYKSEHKENVFVKGVRQKRKILESAFTFCMQIVTLLVLRVNLSDINGQPKLFSRRFFESHLDKNSPTDFSLDLYALYKAKTQGEKLKTVPVYYKPRLFGEAKGGGGSWKNRWNLIKRTSKYIFELRKKLQ